MNQESIDEFIRVFRDNDLTPNEFFFLYGYLSKKFPIKRCDPEITTNSLIENGWFESAPHLPYGVRLTEKFFDADLFSLEKNKGNLKDLRKNVELYRLMWPAITLPTGVQARCPALDIEKRFLWFFKNYNYSWETIFKATENYLSHYVNDGYKFMKNSCYFICKNEGSLKSSTLASWCDRGMIEDMNEKSFDINV